MKSTCRIRALGDELDDAQRMQLCTAVAKLPDLYRLPVYLYYYEELSIKEVACRLCIKESAVKQRLSRAREMIRKSIDE